jgi:hypothetical protein
VLGILLLAAWPALAHADPIIWVDDSVGNIGKVDVPTGAVTFVGNAGVVLTDIAFDPKGNLYGIDFGNLYSISTTTGAATKIASLSGALAGGANALVFGTLFSAGFTSTHLFSINPATGATTDLGNVGGFSAGDLAFANGHLYLTDFASGPPSGPSDLIRIDLNPNNTVATFADVGPIGFSNVFGLASPDNVSLIGVAGTQVLSINPATGAGTVVSNYAGQGLFDANGSAFITESGFQPPPPAEGVPEPGTLALFGLGVLSLAVLRRRRKGDVCGVISHRRGARP